MIPQVSCGYHPYAEIQSDIVVVNEIMEGIRPKKLEGGGAPRVQQRVEDR